MIVPVKNIGEVEGLEKIAPIFYILRSWLNWIEHLTSDQTVGGSSPSERAKHKNKGQPKHEPLYPNAGMPRSKRDSRYRKP